MLSKASHRSYHRFRIRSQIKKNYVYRLVNMLRLNRFALKLSKALFHLTRKYTILFNTLAYPLHMLHSKNLAVLECKQEKNACEVKAYFCCSLTRHVSIKQHFISTTDYLGDAGSIRLRWTPLHVKFSSKSHPYGILAIHLVVYGSLYCLQALPHRSSSIQMPHATLPIKRSTPTASILSCLQSNRIIGKFCLTLYQIAWAICG